MKGFWMFCKVWVYWLCWWFG